MKQTGELQARASGRCLSNLNLRIDAVYTSMLQRSRWTYRYLAEEMPSLYKNRESPLPLVASWRLNERHYGALVGLSKSEAETRMGRIEVMGWRRSWNLRPPPMEKHPYNYSKSTDPSETKPMFDWQSEIWSKALRIESQHNLDGTYGKEILMIEQDAVIPRSESLEDTANRVLPLWKKDIFPRIYAGENVLVVGHSNTIRSIVKHLDNLSEDGVREVVIPSAIPLIYSFALDAESSSVHSIGKASSLGMKGRFIVTKELLELSLSASQNLEMSENLDEGDEFKNLLSEALSKVTTHSSTASNSLGSLQDAEGSSRPSSGSLMDSGWMTVPLLHRQQ